MNPPSPTAVREDPQTLAAELVRILDALAPVLEEEAALARSGRLNAAAALLARKNELTASYVTASRRLMAVAKPWPPAASAALAALRAKHATFRAALETNMMVVATTHAVAEDLIRNAAIEVARRKAPQTYGASGRATPARPRSAAAVAVNRAC